MTDAELHALIAQTKLDLSSQIIATYDRLIDLHSFKMRVMQIEEGLGRKETEKWLNIMLEEGIGHLNDSALPAHLKPQIEKAIADIVEQLIASS